MNIRVGLPRVLMAGGIAASACGGGDGGDDGDDGPEPRQVVVELRATPMRDLDLLFVEVLDGPSLTRATRLVRMHRV